MARFIVLAGEEPGREIALPAFGELKIGRLPEIGITLADTKSSREHCRLFHQSTGWVVEDLKSRNGTWVNGHRIDTHRLQPGDVLHVGRHDLQYDDRNPGDPPPPPPQPRAPATDATGAPAAPAAPSGPAFPTLRTTKKRRHRR